MTIRLAGVLAALAWVVSTSQSGAQDAKRDCSVAALTAYTRENLELLQKDFPFMSVDTMILRRRLQEQYCLRFAQCLAADGAIKSLQVSTLFSSCLEDEALEQYDAKRR
jgi:hypothetical protein